MGAVDQLRWGDTPQDQQKSAASTAKTRTWDPATGEYVEEDVPAELLELMGNTSQSKAPLKQCVDLSVGDIDVERDYVDRRKSRVSRTFASSQEESFKSMQANHLRKIELGESLVKEGQECFRLGQMKKAHEKYR